MKKLLILMMVICSFSFSNEIEKSNEKELELLEKPVLEEINLTDLAFEEEVNLLKGNLVIINQKLEELNKNLLEKNIKIDNLENKIENLSLLVNNLENKMKDNKSEVTTNITERIYRYGVIFISMMICIVLSLISMIVYQNSKNRKKMEEWRELLELKSIEKKVSTKNLKEEDLEELFKEM